MPVIRLRRPEWTAARSRESLVEQLDRELHGEATADPRPVVFEVPINRNQTSIHVIVVWDSWEGVSPEDRAAVIIEAYERWDALGSPDEAMARRITAAIGVTAEEAIQMNLLPYQISPTIVAGLTDREDVQRKVREAMAEEGAIESAGGPLLAFPSRPMAEEAYRKL